MNVPEEITKAIKATLDQGSAPRHNVTFSINRDSLATLEACTNKIRLSYNEKASRLFTLRTLIDIYKEISEKGNSDLKTEINQETKNWLESKATQNISLSITEQQRITLRKLEVKLQMKNWSIPINRNDAVQLLIKEIGCYLISNQTKPYPSETKKP